ncbi:YopX family protein [Desulfosporosinus youngiae]|uniref:YopX protein n=1 Tax=Desulfosporosinus youngiae DSM 17734 TaxID=768710 RepID=H5XST8_9FIRM|nr:YopX family protein [Desulfosporosinus youngiae]EHQ87756.1 YopX protein [Desulfosporosinus youngiae DSM 17734]
MREQKFRVWDRIQEKMLKPQALSFDMQSSAPFAVSVPGRSWEPIGKYILMQWTGFSDSNGIEVYEGDLVRISSIIYKVVWNKTLATFELLELGSFSKCEISTVECSVVIGNEFQKSNLSQEKLRYTLF